MSDNQKWFLISLQPITLVQTRYEPKPINNHKIMQTDLDDSASPIQPQIHLPEDKVEIPKKLTLKQKKSARRAKLLIGKSKGRWSLDERRQYYVFLKIYSQFFVSKDHRRNDKVYRMMANFIKSRTPDQCRTHHQKLQVKFNRISRILQALREEFGPIQFDQIVRKCDLSTTVAGTPPQMKEQQLYCHSNNKIQFQWSYDGGCQNEERYKIYEQQAQEVVVKQQFEQQDILLELGVNNPRLY